MKIQKKQLGIVVTALFVIAVIIIAGIVFASLSRNGDIIIVNDDTTAPSTEDNGVIFIRETDISTLSEEDVINSIVKPSGTTVVKRFSLDDIPDEKISFEGAGNLSQQGYYISDGTYGDGEIIARFTAPFTLPGKYSLSQRTAQSLEYVQLSDYSEFTPQYTDYTEDRPAIELYMGYIFVDNGTNLDVYTSTGNYIMSFSDTEYIPAYTRDIYGNPLFYRNTTGQSGLYAEDDIERETEIVRIKEPKEKEENVLLLGKLVGETAQEEPDQTRDVTGLTPLYEDQKIYYSISPGGYFAQNGYDDMIHSRGLYFDYPSYYGISDSGIQLSAAKYDEVTKKIDGKMEIEHKAHWTYKVYGNPITEDEFDRAYNFRNGLACVVTESYYDDGGLYFITTGGNRAFNTLSKYVNNMDRYVIDNYVPPITTGPESIGYFYYDHGLVRVRKEQIDYYNYITYNKIRVNYTKEILIDADGKEFDIPVGYEIKSYSDGMILLEKDGKYGFMDYTGAWIAEPIYTYAEPFYEGLAVLSAGDGKTGMIDTKGNIIFPFAYDHISSCSDGVITAYSESNGWEIFFKLTK